MPFESNPLWYKDAIIYQLHVRAFNDSDGDGIGDFAGLTQKLDYLQDLGVTALWLLPFYPSPLKDDGYDIAEYTTVNPAYGTLTDFKIFLREAHRRGLRVITELVINHTSDQHPWFQRARTAKPGSAHRDFYVWSDKPDKYLDARIIFKDFETSNWTWDPVANAYYWHRFYHHQPDLNFENPQVKKAIFKVLDFWMNLGVDGMRLDAVPYLYERDGTNCENLPETHTYLKALRAHIDRNFKDRMLLAEANQWPEDSVAYFGDGDECHMNFHFPVMPRMFMAVQAEDRFPLIDILKQTPPIPENSQWAVFLRNHDELTLEMVTDEERDYMYRMYAHDTQARINLGIRRRLAPLLSNNRRKIELMNGLLFALPGTPIIYYGDEIGIGDNIYLGDRNGVRTPMQWSPDRNAGFSRANPQKLYLPLIIDPEYHYEAVNVEAQQRNPQSLLWWMKRLIALRNHHKAFGSGSLHFLYPDNPKVLAFIRKYEHECILVVANLSRFVQYAELDLSAYKGHQPVELFGRSEFPPITENPYILTLGPHNFYWFSIELPRAPQIGVGAGGRELPVLKATGDWEELLGKDNRRKLENILPEYIAERRWFSGKAKKLKSVSIGDAIPVLSERLPAAIALLHIDYHGADAEMYQLPLAFAEGEAAEALVKDTPNAVIARLQINGKAPRSGVIFDAAWSPEFSRTMLSAIERRRMFRGQQGEIVATPQPAFKQLRGDADKEIVPNVLSAEQSNTSVVFGSRFIFKFIRRLDNGINPELEIGRFLENHVSNTVNVPPIAGALEYRRGKDEHVTLGILHGFVHNEGNAWTLTLDTLGRFYEKVMALPDESLPGFPVPAESLLTLAGKEIEPQTRELIETYLDAANLLGRRTGEFHLALAHPTTNQAFAPEAFSTLYQRSVYQSMRNLTAQTMQLLRKQLRNLAPEIANEAAKLLTYEDEILARFAQLTSGKFTAQRIRVHGDYHLGQVLFTGKDFVIIDLEGEPMRSLSERRIKRSPLRDTAGMLRSFQYAAFAAKQLNRERGLTSAEDDPKLERWADYWYAWVASSFLRGYLATATAGRFLPKSETELRTLLDSYLLDKAMYELGYELNNRPAWLPIPLRGLMQLIERKG